IDGVSYVLEPRPGLDIARNTGIRHSTGEIIAYVDDDVSIHPDWVDGLLRGFRDPAVMALAGLVLASELTTKSQLIFEQYWSFNRGYQPLIYAAEFYAKYQRFGVPTWRIGAGANMAFRRDIFGHVGDFDERLDVGAAGCSGDSEFWYRVLAAGWKCRYEPTAVVYHRHRATMGGLRRQLFSYMRGHVAALLIRFERYAHWGNLIHVGLLAPYYVKLILFGWTKGRERYTTLWQEITGCFAGVMFYLKNRGTKAGQHRKNG
ncbi:MAG: glycosyltransferase, partial [Gammaproteobacteria bacterium]|nr:glycosyltransferase [Gammaproteobacteria bacterium]